MKKLTVKTSFTTIGRRFESGDLVLITNDEILHIYKDSDMAIPELITTKKETCTTTQINLILKNTIEVKAVEV